MSRLILNKNQSLKFLFCLITFHLYSANSQNHKFHLNFALGAGLNKRYDSYQSKIVYSGISALGLIGLSHVHEKWHNHFWAAGFGGLMHNPNLETYTLYNFGFEAQLSIKRLASSSLLKHKWFIGLGNCTTSDISYHQSFQNNAWSWVSVSTIGIANRFEKSFQIKKKLLVGNGTFIYLFMLLPSRPNSHLPLHPTPVSKTVGDSWENMPYGKVRWALVGCKKTTTGLAFHTNGVILIQMRQISDKMQCISFF